MDMMKHEAYELELIKRDKLRVDEKNIFVIAGAGAGKSTSLVSRIVGFLGNGEKTADYVAISFTNKAAEELRTKIINELSARINKDEYLEFRDNLIDALNNIDQMHISTIHKFCADILRENSVFAKLNPSFKILVDEDDLNRKKKIFDNFFKGLKESDFDNIMLFNTTSRTIKKDMEHIYNKLCEYVDKIELDHIYNINYQSGLDASNLINDYEAYLSLIKKNMEYLVELSNYDDNPKKKKTINSEMDILKTGWYELIYNEKEIDLNYVLKFKYDFPFKRNKFLKNVVKEEFQEFSASFDKEINKFNQRKEAFLKDYSVKIVKYAYNAYLKYLDYIDLDKDNISNNQCIYLVSKLLKENNDVLLKLKNHYKHIYIDEYQDTDHLQRDIALLLTTTNNEFIPNSLYLVGDPKQSIYRFRGAEPEVYFETMKLFSDEEAKCYDLNINFRSNDKIIDYVNHAFKNIKLTSEAYTNMLVAKSNLIREEDYLNNDNLIGFYNYLGKDPSSIANLILYLVNNKYVRSINRDKDGNLISEYKHIEFKDIMVLMQNHDPMSEYVQEFTIHGIPTKVSGESNFYAYEAIRAFVNLFTSIATTSERNIELASSVFKNIYKDKFRGLTFDKEKELINDLYTELVNNTIHMSAYGKAIYLANHLEWLIEEDSINKAFIINSIRSKLFQMIEEIYASSYFNGNELALQFQKYVNTAIEYESLIDDEANCVSIINTHKAKGLEAKIVIWVSIDNIKKERHPSSAYKDGILYLNECAKEGIYRSTQIDLLDDEAASVICQEEDSERARLEYVIATRPKEAFIYAYDDKSKGLFFEYDNDVYSIHGLRRLEVEDKTYEAINEVSDYEHKQLSFSESSKGIKYVSPSKLENISKTRLAEYEKHKDNMPASLRPQSAIVGTILHKAFELLVLDKDHNVNKVVNEAISKYIAIIEDYDNLFKFISTCVKELNKYYLENNIYDYTLYPELNYSYSKEKNIISNGSIDLLAINNNDCIIIDYKSDEAIYIEDEEVFKNTLLEKYKVQIDEYVKALKDLKLEVNNIKKLIIYFRNYNSDKETIDLKVLNIK